MKPLWIKPIHNWEIGITTTPRKWSRPLHMPDNEADRLLNISDYQELQAELKEKYWFLVNKILQWTK